MVTVFIWPGLLHGNVGHAAIRVDGGVPPGEIYISWWPAGVGGIIPFLLDLSTPAMLGTFESDNQAEGNVNSHTIQIFGLDEGAIKAWWATWLTDMDFRLFHRNCAVTVAKALAVGAHDPLVVTSDEIWTPFSVWMYARQIQIVKKLFG